MLTKVKLKYVLLKTCIEETRTGHKPYENRYVQGDKKSTQQVNYGKTTPPFPKKSYW